MDTQKLEVAVDLTPETLAVFHEVGLIMDRARLRGDEALLSAAGSFIDEVPESLERVPGDVHGFAASGARKLTCFFKIKESLLARVPALRAGDR